MKQFGQLSPEVEKERRFAVFRAAEIKRHLDEGRDPPPLQPQGDRSPTSSEPPPKKEAAPPLSHFSLSKSFSKKAVLVDYDPGYVVGSKVVFIDADTRLFRKGVIQGKAQEGKMRRNSMVYYSVQWVGSSKSMQKMEMSVS